MRERSHQLVHRLRQRSIEDLQTRCGNSLLQDAPLDPFHNVRRLGAPSRRPAAFHLRPAVVCPRRPSCVAPGHPPFGELWWVAAASSIATVIRSCRSHERRRRSLLPPCGRRSQRSQLPSTARVQQQANACKRLLLSETPRGGGGGLRGVCVVCV